MKAKRLAIYRTSGDTDDIIADLATTDGETITPVSDSASVALEIATSPTTTANATALGAGRFSFNGDDLQAIPADAYAYDIKVTELDNKRYTIARGIITFDPEV